MFMNKKLKEEFVNINNYISNTTTHISSQCTFIENKINKIKDEILNISKMIGDLRMSLNEGYKLADNIFNEKYEKNNVELAVVKTFIGKPKIIHNGKRLDIDAKNITIYINEGEFVEVDIEK